MSDESRMTWDNVYRISFGTVTAPKFVIAGSFDEARRIVGEHWTWEIVSIDVERNDCNFSENDN